MLKYRITSPLYVDLREETAFHFGNMRHGKTIQKNVVVLQTFAGSDHKQGAKAVLYSFPGLLCGLQKDT